MSEFRDITLGDRVMLFDCDEVRFRYSPLVWDIV